MSKPRPLTRRQRQILSLAYDHMKESGAAVGRWATLFRLPARIGDVRVLNGLTLRGLMTHDDHDDTPHRIEVWPRMIRITAAGVAEWERILAERPAQGPVMRPDLASDDDPPDDGPETGQPLHD